MATEIDSLLVRMIGDGSSYQQMLKVGVRSTKDAAAKIGTSMDRLGRKVRITFKKLARQLDELGPKLKKVGNQVGSLGRRMAVGLTLPVVAMGTASVVAFTNFDKAMTTSTSIMDVTEQQIAAMRDTALSLSSSGAAVQSATELAESYFFLASAGKSAAQSMMLLPQVASFATAGNFDMALATDLLTDAQSALGLTSKNLVQDTKNLTRVSDVLVKANTLANGSVQQFAESLTNTAAASLRAFSKDIEEGTAVLAAYADQGVKGAVAGTSLSRVMLLLSKSARDSAEAHAELGFSVFDNNGKMRNFADIIRNLEDVTAGMSDEVKSATLEQLGFQARVQQAILPLLGMSDAVRKYEEELRKAKGTTETVAERQMKSFANRMTAVKNKVTNAGIAIGQSLVPHLEKLMKVVESGVEWWGNLNESMQGTLIKAAAVVAILGPLLMVVGSLASAAGTMAIAFTGLGVTLTGVATAAKVATAALFSLTAFTGLSIIVAAAAISVAVYKASDAVRDYNEAVKEGAGLQDQITTNFENQTANIITQVTEGGSQEDAIAQATKEIEGYEQGLLDSRNAVKEIDGWWKRATGNKVLEEANSQIAEQEKLLKLAKDRLKQISEIDTGTGTGKAMSGGTTGGGLVDETGESSEAKKAREAVENTIDSLMKQVDTLGMSKEALVLYDLEANKATKAQKDLAASLLETSKAFNAEKKLMEQGKQLTEKFKTPQEKLADQQEMLSNLLDKNVISLETYTRALKAAEEQAKGVITPEQKKITQSGPALAHAARRGSAEAAGRIDAFRRRTDPGVPKGAELSKKDQALAKNTEAIERFTEKLEENKQAGNLTFTVSGLEG